MLPLASILLYRNSFPYFYAFILPPVMVGTALAIKQILDRISVKMLSIELLANAAIISLATPRVVLPVQRQVLAAAHEIFPEQTERASCRERGGQYVELSLVAVSLKNKNKPKTPK